MFSCGWSLHPLYIPATPPDCLITHPLFFPRHFCTHHFLLHPSPALSIKENIRIQFHLAWVLYSFSCAFYPIDHANNVLDVGVVENQNPFSLSNFIFHLHRNRAFTVTRQPSAFPFAPVMAAIADFGGSGLLKSAMATILLS